MNDLKNKILNIILIILIVAVLAVGVARFSTVTKGDWKIDSLQITSPESIKIQDINGLFINFSDLLNKVGITYVLVFDSNDCQSCIFKGIEDLKRLKKEGRETIALMIHESLTEAQSFSSVNNIEQLKLLSRVTFYEQFQCAFTPVMVKLKGGRVLGYRYIKP